MGLFGGGDTDVDPTKTEKQLAADSARQHNDHQTRFMPLENSFISSLTPSAGESAQRRGEATSSLAQAAKGADASLVRRSAGANDGRSLMARALTSTDVGTARGNAAAGADALMRTKELTGKTKMVAFGRGLQDMNRLSLTDRAQQQTKSAITELNDRVTQRGQMFDAVGNFAGTAMANTGSMSTLRSNISEKYGWGG